MLYRIVLIYLTDNEQLMLYQSVCQSYFSFSYLSLDLFCSFCSFSLDLICSFCSFSWFLYSISIRYLFDLYTSVLKQKVLYSIFLLSLLLFLLLTSLISASYTTTSLHLFFLLTSYLLRLFVFSSFRSVLVEGKCRNISDSYSSFICLIFFKLSFIKSTSSHTVRYHSYVHRSSSRFHLVCCHPILSIDL